MAMNPSWIGRLLTWIVIAFLVIAAVKVSFAVVGVLTGVAFFFLFTVAPLVLVGWLAVKVVRYFLRGDEYDPA
ncbi:hypothetical protein BH23GEM3_BH23GEM3_10630 [soil metagenome]|nr:hypothetical protein [Gemmatimonadota bacterium]